jgi:trehalose utilization protein
MQPLADKEKIFYAQLGYPTYYNETTQKMLNAMRQYSNTINNKYISKKRTQPVQAQQPVQAPK